MSSTDCTRPRGGARPLGTYNVCIRLALEPRNVKNLLILSFSNISADARVLKQVEEFSKDFRVTTCGYGPTPPGVADHVEIPEDFRVWAYPRLALIQRRYRDAYWGNKAIEWAKDALAGREFDVVLADEVDAVPLALSLEPKSGVHADLHEYSPKEKEDVLKWRLFIAPFRSWLVKKFVTQCDSVTTVAPGIAKKYEEVFAIKPEVVRNATPFHDFEVTPTSSPIRLVHSGACLADRRPEIMLDALAATTADVTLDLYLTPNDAGKLAELKARAERMPNVTVHDAVPYEELLKTLNEYDVGISVLPPANLNNLLALPNKLFDYIQARLGIIIGPSPEMARIVKGEEVGAVANGFDGAALAKVLDGLTVERVEQWKQNSARAARDLAADVEVEKWRKAIDQLVAAD